MFSIYFQTKFSIPFSNHPLVIAVKLEAERKLRMAAMLFLHYIKFA
jgi:hypothetical protein